MSTNEWRACARSVWCRDASSHVRTCTSILAIFETRKDRDEISTPAAHWSAVGRRPDSVRSGRRATGGTRFGGTAHLHSEVVPAQDLRARDALVRTRRAALVDEFAQQR